MAEIVPEGLIDEVVAQTDINGVFTFTGVAGKKYRIYLPDYGVGSRKTLDTSGGTDVDLGNVLFERCPIRDSVTPPNPPTTSDSGGDLDMERVIIEPQKPPDMPWRGIREADSGVNANLSASTEKSHPNSFVELPPCWSGPTLENRADWQALPMISLDRYVSVESFVGGKMKRLRVIRYDPNLTPDQIKTELRKVWFGMFRYASASIMWSEGNLWNIEAIVEQEDGTSSSLLMDDWIHVRVQDRKGKYWYIRLWPAVQ